MKTLSCIVLSLLFAITALPVLAEEHMFTGNEFVQVDVLKESGSFHITKANGDPLSNSEPDQWFSYTTFYLNASGGDVYYTNAVMKQKSPASFKDMGGKQSIYLHPDSTFQILDTIRTIWNNMRNFRVYQDLYPIKTGAGGQIVIKYSVTARPENTNNRFKGVLLMLDVAVRPPSTSDQCSPVADKPIILTSTKYSARPVGGASSGVCWIGVEHRYTDTTGLPEWFLAGMRFPDYGGSGFDIGKGTLIGPGLYPPTEFIVGDWVRMIDTTWDYFNMVTNHTYDDAAVVYKWPMDIVAVGQSKLCATAYGMNDHKEEYSICYNTPPDPMMIITKTSPLVHYRLPNGNLDSLSTKFDVWVVNADHQERSTQNDMVTINLANAADFVTPSNITQPPYVPVVGSTSSDLGLGMVGHTSWRLLLDSSKLAAMVDDYVENVGFHLTTPNIPAMKSDCDNLVQTTYQGPAADVTAPVISRASKSTRTKSFLDINETELGHRGIRSIDTITVTNYRVGGYSFSQCDSAVEIGIQVKDTTMDALFVLQATDCAGNASLTWTETFSAHTGGVDDPLAPGVLSIRNYPNPFSDATEVDVYAASTRLVTDVRMYSSLGADVTRDANIQTSETQAGWHINISARKLTPGLYTLAVSGPEGTRRHTMLLMR